MPNRARASSEAVRVADPSSREIQVKDSRFSRDGRLRTSVGRPTITISFSSNGSASISGPDDTGDDAQFGAMQPKPLDRFCGRTKLQSDAHCWVRVLEIIAEFQHSHPAVRI